jgi:hypothetical protein
VALDAPLWPRPAALSTRTVTCQLALEDHRFFDTLPWRVLPDRSLATVPYWASATSGIERDMFRTRARPDASMPEPISPPPLAPAPRS